MVHFHKLIILFFTVTVFSSTSAQVGESPIRLFGYFQIPFSHQSHENSSGNSFVMQQMNIFAQKDLTKDWTSLINLEFLNTYSSNKFWGAFNLEEAWVRYRVGRTLNIKIGLQIPIFNNLNEINNRMPLLPYIIRPLAYETSFGEFLDIESFLPKRTFVQAYGYFPSGDLKIDYAVFLGNSPNIGSVSATSEVQSGIDTTNTFLLGGRTGIRFKDLKAGISFSFDKVAQFKGSDTLIGLPSSTYDLVNRFRIGADFSYSFRSLSLEAEYIKILYDDSSPIVDFDKRFYYVTVNYQVRDDLLAYLTFCKTQENSIINISGFPSFEVNVSVPSIGAAFDFNDRIRLKAQYGKVKVNVPNIDNNRFDYYTTAISVFF